MAELEQGAPVGTYRIPRTVKLRPSAARSLVPLSGAIFAVGKVPGRTRRLAFRVTTMVCSGYK